MISEATIDTKLTKLQATSLQKEKLTIEISNQLAQLVSEVEAAVTRFLRFMKTTTTEMFTKKIQSHD